MAIIRAEVGDYLKEFSEVANLSEVLAFVAEHLGSATTERAVVLMGDSGATIGELWNSSLYFAHWKSPAKMRAYFDLNGFDQGKYEQSICVVANALGKKRMVPHRVNVILPSGNLLSSTAI